MNKNISFIPQDPDGNLILGKKALRNENKKQQAEAKRKAAFCHKSEFIESLIKAFGSQGIGCGHVHHNVSVNTQNETFDDEESQELPSYPDLEIKEAEDWAVRIGKLGEVIASLGGVFAIAPVLDLILMLLDKRPSESAWFSPNSDVGTSPAMLLAALVLIIPAIYGGPHCHAQLEIASRTRDNFISLAKYAQKLLKWGNQNNLAIDDERLKMPTIKIDNKEIPIDEFVLISPQDAVSLNLEQKLQIVGDVQQHFNEYIGLIILAIVRNIKNSIALLVLIPICLIVAAIACYPEVKTCSNTLRFMNTLRNGKVINNPSVIAKANFATKFSAFAKTPTIFYANFLSFRQICFGNIYGASVFAFLATKGNIITQYFINRHTQSLGESASRKLSHNPRDFESNVLIPDTDSWRRLTLFGKELVVSRAFGTGNERSEPIIIVIIAFADLFSFSISEKNQVILALVLCLAGTLTAYSEARNSADHIGRESFFNKKDLSNYAIDEARGPLLLREP